MRNTSNACTQLYGTLELASRAIKVANRAFESAGESSIQNALLFLFAQRPLITIDFELREICAIWELRAPTTHKVLFTDAVFIILLLSKISKHSKEAIN